MATARPLHRLALLVTLWAGACCSGDARADEDVDARRLAGGSLTLRRLEVALASARAAPSGSRREGLTLVRLETHVRCEVALWFRNLLDRDYIDTHGVQDDHPRAIVSLTEPRVVGAIVRGSF